MSTQSSPPVNDPTALAKFGQLDFVARLIVEGYMLGQHKSPFKGSSVEFVEHRQYYPGDEIRHVDWRAYAKLDRYYVKQFEQESQLTVYLVLDASASMEFAGGGLRKLDYAALLLASIAHLVIRQQLLDELPVGVGDQGLEVGLELVGVGGAHALVLAGDHDVDAVGLVADVLVDPVQLDLELLRGEADGAEHAEAAGLGDGDDDVTTVGEGEDRELDAELLGQVGLHGSGLLSGVAFSR